MRTQQFILKAYFRNSIESTTSHHSVLKGGGDVTAKQFVILLKSKVDKDTLKKLICEIKKYKEHGQIEPLLTLLKEWYQQEIINKEDIEQFRPFVRKDDEKAFNEIL